MFPTGLPSSPAWGRRATPLCREHNQLATQCALPSHYVSVKKGAASYRLRQGTKRAGNAVIMLLSDYNLLVIWRSDFTSSFGLANSARLCAEHRIQRCSSHFSLLAVKRSESAQTLVTARMVVERTCRVRWCVWFWKGNFTWPESVFLWIRFSVNRPLVRFKRTCKTWPPPEHNVQDW